MYLAKNIPARIETFEATQCKLDWMAMSQRFRDIRSKSRNPMDKCHWCKHPFVDGEMMAIALSNKGNNVLCQTCGKKLLESAPWTGSAGR